MMLKTQIEIKYKIISKVLRNLDEAIAYIKQYPENYSESYLDINKPPIEQELRNELHQVWTKPIYRMIAVDDKKELNRNNLGRYWTYNKDRAKAYWGSGDHRARITARVKESDIDWLETVEMHLNPKYVNEDEVRLLENAKPIILKVEWIRVKSHKAIMKSIIKGEHPSFSPDYPLVHYTRDKDTPTLNPHPTHTDPDGIYFFTKRHPPWGGGWDQGERDAQYAHEAKIDTSHQLNFEHISKSEAEAILKKAGLTLQSFMDICKDPQDDRGISGTDLDYSQRPEKLTEDTFNKQWDSNWKWAWYAFLKDKFQNKHEFSNLFKKLGYTSLYDPNGIMYSGEEHVVIALDPNIITWGTAIPYDCRKDFHVIHSNFKNKVQSLYIFANDDDEIGSGKHALTTDKSGKFWGDAGAGGVFYSTKTKRFLLAFRSKYVNEPRTWGVWGGAIDKNETPTEAIKREIKEETKYSGKFKLIPSFVYKKGDFQYHNFIIEVEDEFKPHLCWETEKFGWFTLDNFPTPLHFGLKALLPYLKKI